MKIIDPETTPSSDLYQFLIGAVAPRPIAFVSTIDKDGQPNLAPYSFFNVVSSNPAVLVFSAVRRSKNETLKDTLENIEATGEAVVNVVSYAIVRQMALTSVELPPDVNEFAVSGLTPLPADLVRPFRVAESPVHFECRLRQILPLGSGGGAGNLVICEIVRIHVAEEIIDERGRINPHKIDLMGRMGRAYYTRASGEAIHTVLQDRYDIPIGFPQLPPTVRHSTVLTGNNLGQLAGITDPPSRDAIEACRKEERVKSILQGDAPLEELHRYAQTELAKDSRESAAAIVWLGEELFG